VNYVEAVPAQLKTKWHIMQVQLGSAGLWNPTAVKCSHSLLSSRARRPSRRPIVQRAFYNTPRPRCSDHKQNSRIFSSLSANGREIEGVPEDAAAARENFFSSPLVPTRLWAQFLSMLALFFSMSFVNTVIRSSASLHRGCA
jgi:hypothetical protein